MTLATSIFQLTCPSCEAGIDSEEVNVKLGVAKCTACHTVFSFADQLPFRASNGSTASDPGEDDAGTPPDTRTAAKNAALPKPEVPLPAGIKVEQWGHELALAWRWFTLPILFLLFFCLAWDSFLVFWYSLAFTDRGAPWIMFVFPVAHVAIGAGLTYFAIASLLNTTRLRIAGGELTVRHGPLPWRGEVTLPAGQIEQIFCSEKIRQGKNGTSTSYRVNAMLTNGRKIELLSGMPEADQALYIEQTIEDHLGITDRAVGGEMRRN